MRKKILLYILAIAIIGLLIVSVSARPPEPNKGDPDNLIDGNRNQFKAPTLGDPTGGERINFKAPIPGDPIGGERITNSHF